MNDADMAAPVERLRREKATHEVGFCMGIAGLFGSSYGMGLSHNGVAALGIFGSTCMLLFCWVRHGYICDSLGHCQGTQDAYKVFEQKLNAIRLERRK